jgi:hypothetical protein
MELSQQQRDHFETFGFLVLPGLLNEEIDWIIEEFESIFQNRGVVHDGSKRSTVVPFIDQREKLSTLLDNPKIVGLISGLLGDDFNYVGGDGNYYTGDTSWHSDGWHDVGKFLKVALYLDPVTATTGCLRVIPGTHKVDIKNWDARKARNAPELWGIAQNQVPAFPLESNPGDVVAFNHNLMHASFGGNTRRRMFTLNCSARAKDDAQVEDLKNYIAAHARFWIDHMHSDIMRGTASPQRMVHLAQVIEHEGHLAGLSAKARLEAAEPSRG